MAYIPNEGQLSLTAFLTQLGRQYLVDGNKDAFEIKYFALSDDQINYLTSWELDGSDYTIPGPGQLPDYSGDYNGDVRSLAGGIGLRSTLSGGTTIGQLGTNGQIGGTISLIGFRDAEYTVNLPPSGTVTVGAATPIPTTGGGTGTTTTA